ncbi:hypothetical protein D3C77_339060 [compost metagenome]
MEQLRAEFSQAIFDAIRECHAFGYHPTKWEAMNRELTPVEASKKLVLSGDFQVGLMRLLGESREHLTVEAIMLRPQFVALFNRELLEMAKWRLAEGKRQLAKISKKA